MGGGPSVPKDVEDMVLAAVQLCDSEAVQIVDDHGNFCERNIYGIINRSSELSVPNAPYSVVSIVGGQCSGKSYLMNRLFGTRFREMDATRDRCGGTRGIMMSRCIWPSSLLLLDFEGFDGRYRAQDMLFEKQTIRFALTVSDIMMVNISIHDICQEEGPSTQLFRLISQERGELPKAYLTKILLVLRYGDEEVPFKSLIRDELICLKSMRKIWGSVNEESMKFEDYIEVNIIGLPDKSSVQFPKEVTVLRKLLSNNISAKVPASSVLDSWRISWDTIKKNLELDEVRKMRGDDPAFKLMASQLAAMLRVQGEKGRDDWSQLHLKLSEVAAMAGDDPRTAGQALLKVAKDASSTRALMRTLEGRVSKANPSLIKHLVLLVADELSMTPLCDSEPVRMVNEDHDFCGGNVDDIIKSSAELSAPNAPYAVISIIGGQSSGKSYLLNRLFGTKFTEMNPGHGRSIGIMMSRCIGPSLLLLDFEGFRTGTKGQDTKFQKQATLFAMTVSDLVIVNMSLYDIGQAEGYATLLFRIIFQERTKLPQGVTKILVVVRRYDGEPPFETLRSKVKKFLEKIWESVVGYVKFKDYIEVNIVGLPKKTSSEFPKEVTLLRKLLSSNRSAKVPSSVFLLRSSILWDTIRADKELDIHQFYPGESIFPSKSIIISRLSSGLDEARASTHSNNYLSATEPRAMTFSELECMTNGFSKKRLIGTGGFGNVYKGVLDNREVIAIKKLKNCPELAEEVLGMSF